MAYSNPSKANNNSMESAVKSSARDLASSYPEVSDIQQDLAALKSDVTKLSQHVYRDGPVHLKNYAQKQIESVRHSVEEKPVQALAIAFFGGLAASILLGRR